MSALLAASTPARASWLTVTNCEMVTIDGHEYGRLTVDISNFAVGPNFNVLDDFLIWPLNGHAFMPFVQFSPPEGWTGSLQGPGGPYYFHALTTADAVHPGHVLSGVQFVLPEPQACYLFQMQNPVLLETEATYFPVCLACPGVTPADASTWGGSNKRIAERTCPGAS